MDLARAAAVHVVRDVHGEGERNARFAMKLDAIMADPVAYAAFDEWVSKTPSLNELFGDTIAKLTDLPMILGIIWLKHGESVPERFDQYRSIVHQLCTWQLQQKMQLDHIIVPSKVHMLLKMHSNFIPTATALCALDSVPGWFSEQIVKTLQPTFESVVARGDRLHRLHEILHSGMLDQLQSASPSTVDAMIDAMRRMEDALEDVLEPGDASGVRRLKRLHQRLPNKLFHKDKPPVADFEQWLSLRLLFADQSKVEPTTADVPLYDVARMCIAMPTNSSVKLLASIFDKLTPEEVLECARKINASHMLAIDDAVLLTLCNAANAPLDTLDSESLSALNATTERQTTGRWLDALGSALMRDEARHGDDTVLAPSSKLSPSLHRLMFHVDLCKLLEGLEEGSECIFVATFYTINNMPFNFARTIRTTTREEHARFAHRCYEALRMSNRKIELDDLEDSESALLHIDEEAMHAFEVALRKAVNTAMSKVEIEDEPSNHKTQSKQSPSHVIVELVDNPTAFPINNLNALDVESYYAMRVLAEVKNSSRRRDWPFKRVTACRMYIEILTRTLPDIPSLTSES